MTIIFLEFYAFNSKTGCNRPDTIFFPLIQLQRRVSFPSDDSNKRRRRGGQSHNVGRPPAPVKEDD